MRKLFGTTVVAVCITLALTGCADGESPADAINGVVENFKEIPSDTANKIALTAAGAAYRSAEAASAFEGTGVTDISIDTALASDTPAGYSYDPMTNALSFTSGDGSVGTAYICVDGARSEPC